MPVPQPSQIARAIALIRHDDLDGAERILRPIIKRNPDLVEALEPLAVLYGMRGDQAEAIKLLRRLAKLRPHTASIHMNLGVAYLTAKRFDDAVPCFRRVLQLTPDDARALESLGDACKSLGRHEEAIAAYERAHDLDPTNGLLLSSLVELKRADASWSGLAAREAGLLGLASQSLSVEPLLLIHVSDDAVLLKRATEAYVEKFYLPLVRRALPAKSYPRRSADGNKIRLAYLSADFHAQATAFLAAELFELHDRTRFEVGAYSYGPDDRSPMRKRLEKAFDQFHDVSGLSSAAVADRIAADRIDILIDLKGYTAGARLDVLVNRPAPIQCHYLGYPGTLGTAMYDYNIVDVTLAPDGCESFFTEKLARLPNCYQVNDRQRAATTPSPTRADVGLSADAIVYCSFNNLQKLSPRTFDAWCRILQRVPDAVLWLLAKPGPARSRLIDEAGRRGVAADRLVFADIAKQSDHLARLALADVALDTHPYNGHTTGSDALWMGVPVVTLAGSTFASRVGASLLTAHGMPELITTALHDYEDLAVALGLDPERRTRLRQRVAESRTTAALFDTPRFVRDLETAYATMYQRYRSGLPADSFSVRPAIG